MDLLNNDAPCHLVCAHEAISQCLDGDGCCPKSCAGATDADCATCGNGIIEKGETCDGACPTTCDDGNPCTVDTSYGSIEKCTRECMHDYEPALCQD